MVVWLLWWGGRWIFEYLVKVYLEKIGEVLFEKKKGGVN